MQHSPLGATALAVVASFALSGCAALRPPSSYSGMAEVTPVATEHSFGLQCLGGIIEESQLDSILVSVDGIRDRTIPRRLTRKTRLSQAGEWLVHTAISKMETTRVRSTLENSDVPSQLTITGAWTQDDELLRRGSGVVDIGWLRGQLGLSGSQTYDYIAGDFVTSENGVVVFSTAIGVMLGSRRAQATLLVENGDEFAEIGFSGRWADGPQLAQRRIAEAATLIHIANYYDIDYRPCLENGWGDPAAFRASIDRYAELRPADRFAAAQQKLSELGHGPVAADGVWGDTSRRALMDYQVANRLPATGELSPVVFALLQAEPAA